MDREELQTAWYEQGFDDGFRAASGGSVGVGLIAFAIGVVITAGIYVVHGWLVG